jgi:hypothetical protein
MSRSVLNPSRPVRFRTCGRPAALSITAAASVFLGVEDVSAEMEALQKVLAFSVGPVVLRPHLNLRETYTDNVFFRATKQSDDFVSVIAPGFGAMFGSDDGNRIRFDYTASQYLYVQNSFLNDTEHSFRFDIQYRGDRLAVSGQTTFEMLSSVPGAEIDRGKIDRSVRENHYRGAYDLTGKTRGYFDVTEAGIDFERGLTLLDVAQFRTAVGAEIDFFSRMTAFGEIFYGQTHTSANISGTPEGSPSDFGGASVGLKGGLGARTVYYAKGGYQIREYRSSTEEGPQIPFFETTLEYRATEKTKASLEYVHRDAISVEAIESSFVTDRTTFRLDHAFGESGKLNASLAFAYVVNDHTGRTLRDRVDNLWRINIGLLYRMEEWLTGKISYEFERFDSSFARLRDYDVNRISIEMTIGLL